MHRIPRLLGFTKHGRAIVEIMGGSGEEDAGDEDQADEDVDDDDDGDAGSDGDAGDGDQGDGDAGDDEPLGPKGTKALEAEKGKRKAATTRAREAERKNAELAAEIERLKNGGKDDEAAKAQREADAQTLARANARILRSEVKTAAKGVLKDPADAFRFLDMSQFEVDDNGDVDEQEVAEAIAQLVKDKPYLAAQGGKKWGGSDGGPRNAVKSQLTREDLAKMSPADRMKAFNEGRCKNLVGG